jgi:hypothetical protein
MTQEKTVHDSLLDAPLHVVNIGIDGFADDLRKQEVPVIQLDWSPPEAIAPDIARLLSKLGT